MASIYDKRSTENYETQTDPLAALITLHIPFIETKKKGAG